MVFRELTVCQLYYFVKWVSYLTLINSFDITPNLLDLLEFPSDAAHDTVYFELHSGTKTPLNCVTIKTHFFSRIVHSLQFANWTPGHLLLHNFNVARNVLWHRFFWRLWFPFQLHWSYDFPVAVPLLKSLFACVNFLIEFISPYINRLRN